MVRVECNGHPISGSPFPVFFSGGNVPLGVSMIPTSTPMLGASSYIGVGQQMGAFSMPGMFPGSTMGGLSQMPMAPSAAAMAAAQSIAAANAFQAAQAAQQQQQQQAGQDNVDGKEEDDEDSNEPICTLQVTNINPILTADQLRQLFNYCGTVIDCTMSESKTTAFVEYSRPEGAKAGLSLNDMPVGGQNLKVELKRKPRSGKHGTGSTLNGMGPPQLPMMMQQAVVMQQMQFQQALYMQQALATQQAAARAATVKSAAEMASARAAEISKRLAGPNDGVEVATTASEPAKTSPRARSKSKSRSKSRSPVRYRRDRRSRSATPARLRRGRSRSRSRDRNHYRSRERGSRYRGGRDPYPSYYSRRDWERERDSRDSRDPYSSRNSRRARSRSRSRDRVRRRSRTRSGSRSRREISPSPRRQRTYELQHRATTRSRRPTRSRSKDVKRSRSKTPRSGSGSPVRRKGSPKGEKVVGSPSASKDHTMSPRKRGALDPVDGGKKASDKVDSARTDQLKSDSTAKNITLGNGTVSSKNLPVDEVLMEIKSSLNTKLDTATILKDLEDRRRKQSSSLENSNNIVCGGVPPPEAVVGSDVGGFKKPLKKGNKEKTPAGDGVSEEEETEVIDDWRDDIKSQGREKHRNREKNYRPISKKSKDEEGEVQNAKASDFTREAKIAKEGAKELQEKVVKTVGQPQKDVDIIDHERKGAKDAESDLGIADMQVEGPQKLVPSQLERVKASSGRSIDMASVYDNVMISTSQVVEEKVRERMMGPDLVSEKLVSTDVREEKYAQKSRDDKILITESVKEMDVLEEVDARLKESKRFDGEDDVNVGNGKSKGDEEMDEDVDEKKRRRKIVEISDGEGDHDRRERRRSRGVGTEGEDHELRVRKKSRDVYGEGEERDRKSRKKSLEDEEDHDKDRRRRRKSQEGDDDEDQDRRRERHRRHQKKHRHEDDVEKAEDEDDVEDADQRKERRRHKKKHRRDDPEKREKKRRKHKLHRKKRLLSESPELSPSGGGKSKRGDDETIIKHKHHRSKKSSERSPSVEGTLESDEGVARKKSSSRHKKKRREPSKSPTESPSSSD